MGKTLDGYPWWSQLTDPAGGTGRADIYAATDCGEEAVSIWIAGKTGKYTDAGDLRMQLPGQRSSGVTSGSDLRYLLAKHGIGAETMAANVAALQGIVRDSVGKGEPVALLGRWLIPSELHWVLGIGYGNDALLAMDPWSGRLTAYRWPVVRSLATGDIVQAGTL